MLRELLAGLNPVKSLLEAVLEPQVRSPEALSE